jgi:uncharacterized membrane protein YsdA (DUF1294 family)
VRHGLKRVAPLLITGAGAIIASSSFRHYVEHHPTVATFVPVIVWLLHAAAAHKSAG